MLQTLFVFRRVSRRPTTGSGRVMIDAIANSPAKPILHTVRIQHLSCHLSEARWLKRRLAQGLCILALSPTSRCMGTSAQDVLKDAWLGGRKGTLSALEVVGGIQRCPEAGARIPGPGGGG